MKDRSTKWVIPIFSILLACAAACVGQTSASLLTGTVFDKSGAVVTGASVTALNEATGSMLKQISNNAGLFAFPSIPVGSYTIIVEMPGFKTARQTSNTLVVGTPLTVNITLEIGSASDVVKVEASAAQVNTSNATLGNVVEKQTIVTLPLNGRNPLNLIVLEPGVTQRSGTTINVNGMRSQAGNVTIDGIEANEASNPTPTNNVFRVNPDNVEEFKVTTSNPTPISRAISTAGKPAGPFARTRRSSTRPGRARKSICRRPSIKRSALSRAFTRSRLSPGSSATLSRIHRIPSPSTASRLPRTLPTW